MLRRPLGAVAVVWTALALLWAVQILLHAPTVALWFLAVLAKESSGFLLAGFALLGLGLAALARLRGARRAAAVLLSLVPVAQA